MPRPLTKDQRRLAFSLLHWFGAAGERQSAAAIAAKLPLIDQRTPRTKEIVASTMEDLVVHGWAVPAADPRGGAGWVLSVAGAALLARVAQPLHDGRLGLAERVVRPAQCIGDGALADLQPKQLGHRPGEAIVADSVLMMQIGQHRHDRRAKRRTGRHRVGRRGAHPPPTGWTALTEEAHPRNHWPDRRQVDVIVGMAQPLSFCAHRGAAAGVGVRMSTT